MKNQSNTITGVLIMLLSTISKHLDLGFNQSDIAILAASIVQFAGMFIVYFDRMGKGDLKNLIGRRKQPKA